MADSNSFRESLRSLVMKFDQDKNHSLQKGYPEAQVRVKMRNFVYANHPGQPIENFPFQVIQQFDQIYGESQQYVGEAVLVCENSALTEAINSLNERMYRTEWYKLSLDQANPKMEEIKNDAISVIGKMRDDIRASTRFEWQDFVHIASGFWKRKTRT